MKTLGLLIVAGVVALNARAVDKPNILLIVGDDMGYADVALRSLADVITSADGKSPRKGRAWASVYLLGSEAKEIVGLLPNANLKEKDQQTLSVVQSRLK